MNMNDRVNADTTKNLNSSNRNKDVKEDSVKLNGKRYKNLLKSLARKYKGSTDPSIRENETPRSKANGDISVSSPHEERLDFVLRRVNSSGHAEGSKSSDDNTRGKLQERKKNLSEITTINFVEYWIPVRLSNVQIEQYCFSLFSNSTLLCSSSRNDSSEFLHDILISTRKCCDHPYVANPSLRTSLVEGISGPEQLDAEIKLSSKLLLLHKMLMEIKERGLRVLIIYQSFGGSGQISNGDILDDIIHQKFGEDSFLRIDGRLSRSKKRSVLNTFNNNTSGQFVCLMETRACIPSIKLSSIDTVIFFNSDWDPINDLRALQKISLDSSYERVKVFRLYSSHTVEEKVLVLAKQGLSLEGNMVNIKQSTRHGLLKWGAPYLFKKLDEYHNLSSHDEHSFLDDVFFEFSTLLVNKGCNKNSTKCSLIMEVEAIGGIYPRNISLLGEMDNVEVMIEKEPPYVFWMKLLENRNPRWKYFSSQSPRTRKAVQSCNDLSEAFGVEEIATEKSRNEVESCEIPTICRRKVTTKLQDRVQKRKRSDLCQGGRKCYKKSRKFKCISNVADRRETIASWIKRQRITAKLTKGQILEHDDLPAFTTVQDGEAHDTTGPSFDPQVPINRPVENSVHDTTGPSFDPQVAINRPVEDSVRPTEEESGPSNGIHESLPRDSGNLYPPEDSQVTYPQILESFCKALEMDLERLQNEKNQKSKLHEDMKLQTKMACEKEIDEIRKKYVTVLRNAEMAFVQENEVIDSRYRIISANKTLAETMTLMKNPKTANFPQGAKNHSIEEIYQHICELNVSTNMTRIEQSPTNQPITSLPGYSIVQLLNQALASASPEAAKCRPAIGQSLERINQSQAAYRFDQRTSLQLQPIVPSFDGYTVRAPAPHLRHMGPFRPATSPRITPHLSTGVMFSPVSFHQVSSRKKQSPQMLHNLPVNPYENY